MTICSDGMQFKQSSMLVPAQTFAASRVGIWKIHLPRELASKTLPSNMNLFSKPTVATATRWTSRASYVHQLVAIDSTSGDTTLMQTKTGLYSCSV